MTRRRTRARPSREPKVRIEGNTSIMETTGLDLTLELEDSETLGAPLVVAKRWRRVPGAKLASHSCDIMSGQLGGVLSEYVDPALVDARRPSYSRPPAR